jgi:hypothetical protein
MHIEFLASLESFLFGAFSSPESANAYSTTFGTRKKWSWVSGALATT